MTTERRAAAKLAAPTINLASLVYGLDAYMLSRGADAGEGLRRAGLEPGDLRSRSARAAHPLSGALGDLRRSPGRSAIRLEVRRPVRAEARRRRRQCGPGLAHGWRSLRNNRALSADRGERETAARPVSGFVRTTGWRIPGIAAAVRAPFSCAALSSAPAKRQ